MPSILWYNGNRPAHHLACAYPHISGQSQKPMTLICTYFVLLFVAHGCLMVKYSTGAWPWCLGDVAILKKSRLETDHILIGDTDKVQKSRERKNLNQKK